jgi:hypothetical protein
MFRTKAVRVETLVTHCGMARSPHSVSVIGLRIEHWILRYCGLVASEFAERLSGTMLCHVASFRLKRRDQHLDYIDRPETAAIVRLFVAGF